MADGAGLDLMVLSALAETFVEGGGDRRARLAADALTSVADPAQLLQLRLVLAAMQSRAANLALAGRATPFTGMSAAARERYLLGWAYSRIPQRRSAFQALRKLLTFLAYADPGVDGPNPRLTDLGYRRDQPPVTPHLAPITPYAIPGPDDPAGGSAPITLEADAVIVGSGAGGGVIADALAAAGRSVVVLEAGPFVDEATMPSNELDAFDRLYLDHGLVTTWDGSVTILVGSAVGGGTVVNWMTSIAAPEQVRAEWATTHGLEGVEGVAWDADVAAVERDLGVSESTHIPPKDAILMRGARALGWEAAPTRRNASACGDCGDCPFGCRRGTKQSGLRVHLARAAAAGARIVPDAKVRRVLIEGGRAVGVEASVLVGDGGSAAGPGPAGGGGRRAVTVRAPVVVVAAGALRSPVVLQASGLGHRGIGRHLRLHPVSVVAGRFSESVDMWRGTMQGARSLEFVDGVPGRNGYAIESAPGHPGLLALALPWEGAAAHARTMAGSAHLAPLIAVTRDGGEGRVSTTRAGGARLDYRLDASGVATLRHGLVAMARVMRAAGAGDMVAVGTPPIWFEAGVADPGAAAAGAAFARFETALEHFDFSPNRGTVFSAHQMGSVRMGAESRDHPCDPWGRVRSGERGDAVIGGLYVGDGSLFPTGIGVNPMITIMALARRTARTILAET